MHELNYLMDYDSSSTSVALGSGLFGIWSSFGSFPLMLRTPQWSAFMPFGLKRIWKFNRLLERLSEWPYLMKDGHMIPESESVPEKGHGRSQDGLCVHRPSTSDGHRPLCQIAHRTHFILCLVHYPAAPDHHLSPLTSAQIARREQFIIRLNRTFKSHDYVINQIV